MAAGLCTPLCWRMDGGGEVSHLLFYQKRRKVFKDTNQTTTAAASFISSSYFFFRLKKTITSSADAGLVSFDSSNAAPVLFSVGECNNNTTFTFLTFRSSWCFRQFAVIFFHLLQKANTRSKRRRNFLPLFLFLHIMHNIRNNISSLSLSGLSRNLFPFLFLAVAGDGSAAGYYRWPFFLFLYIK